MSAMGQRPLAMPAAATTAIFTLFSIYYLFAAEHVVEMSVTRYSHFDRPLRDVLSLVASGLVRKRGVLFLADVLYIQLASSVEKAHEGMTAFVWALRLVLGAAQAYYNVAVDTAMWRPWPGIAEVLTMSGLALLWIRATLQASSNSLRRTTADILDSADVPETFTGGGSKAKGMARKAGTSTSPADAIPTPVFVVLMAAAALSSLGLGIMLHPDIAVQQLVADTFHQHHAAVEAAVATPAAGTRHSAIILFKAVHLSTSRAFAQLVGLQLFTEALQLFLLPRMLVGLPGVLRLLQACAVRAVLTTAVCVYNSWMEGLAPAAHVDTAMSAAFAVAYVALYVAYRGRRSTGKGAKAS